MGGGVSAARSTLRGSAPRLKAMAWEQVEELVIHWLVDVGLDSWFELAKIEMELEELKRKDCECRHCRNITWAMGLELQEMLEAAASDLLPEVRLRAVNRSARLFASRPT